MKNNMNESKFWMIKYIGKLKQEIQDKIVDTTWDLGSPVVRAKKLEEQGQRVVCRTRQHEFIE